MTDKNASLSYELGRLMYRLLSEPEEGNTLPADYEAVDNFVNIYDQILGTLDRKALRNGFIEECCNSSRMASEEEAAELYRTAMQKIDKY